MRVSSDNSFLSVRHGARSQALEGVPLPATCLQVATSEKEREKSDRQVWVIRCLPSTKNMNFHFYQEEMWIQS